MAEKSGFFDAHLVNGEYDRVYLAESFAKYFASFIANGIFGGKSNELMVQQKSTPDMSVNVLSGQAWINGYWYENDSELSLAVDVADGVLNRIDSIILRWDNVERVVRLLIKKGTPASNPSAPVVQRDADYYELKLAQILIKAGATKITQMDITDTRLDEEVCGLVVGVVQQLDTQEFGKQLGLFVEDFVEHYEDWFSEFENNSNSKVDTLISENQTKVNKLLSDGTTSINGVVTTGQQNIAKVVSDGTTNINKVITDGQTSIGNVVSKGTTDINNLINAKTAEVNTAISENQQKFDDLAEELEKVVADNDIAALILRVNNLEDETSSLGTGIENLGTGIETLNNLFKQSGPNPGCYYRLVTVNGETVNEWINPPNEVGIVYRTTERWNGKPVYQKLFYVGALPNKTLVGISVDAHYTKIISVSGFAIDNENLMHYPFPIVQNGLTPIAVIQGVESNGGDESLVVIQTNEDISHMTGYIQVKYTKE